jgi:hypothetical protein
MAWCAARGHRLQGTRWEIYGDWADDPAVLETQVSYLIRTAGPCGRPAPEPG